MKTPRFEVGTDRYTGKVNVALIADTGMLGEFVYYLTPQQFQELLATAPLVIDPWYHRASTPTLPFEVWMRPRRGNNCFFPNWAWIMETPQKDGASNEFGWIVAFESPIRLDGKIVDTVKGRAPTLQEAMNQADEILSKLNFVLLQQPTNQGIMMLLEESDLAGKKCFTCARRLLGTFYCCVYKTTLESGKDYCIDFVERRPCSIPPPPAKTIPHIRFVSVHQECLNVAWPEDLSFLPRVGELLFSQDGTLCAKVLCVGYDSHGVILSIDSTLKVLPTPEAHDHVVADGHWLMALGSNPKTI